MFDVSSDDIAALNDGDLRNLIARLCEAELTHRGLSTAYVTAGGNQDAADGGVDVRVQLPDDASIDGYIPRLSTGFQVKKSDLAPAKIPLEMRRKGRIRPVIEDLADVGGSYIIVSSSGSTADSSLERRRVAMRKATKGVRGAETLHVDYYDRTRVASWVRCHAGLIAWVRERSGGSTSGWRGYGAWAAGGETIESAYILDDDLKIHFGIGTESGATAAAGLDRLRSTLSAPRTVVRLVGLSGVGKTRFVQSLFDSRIGTAPLAPSLAVYANIGESPSPSPSAMVSDLKSQRRRAIVIVDNCPPELHRVLADLVRDPDCQISLLTVEYDVRDDQPEGTEVVSMEPSSPELIEKLVQRRFPSVSQVDRQAIAHAAGGNARIAIAIAATVGSGRLGGLNDTQLFQRMFFQRNQVDSSLLAAAEVCSLVYSFDGESLVGVDSELSRLADLAGSTVPEFYRHVSEISRRDLLQKRGIWRAVLPHAVANRLAQDALDRIPYATIERAILGQEHGRLAKSFSRRLSFLVNSPVAGKIVEKWLSAGGLLGDVATLNDIGRTMFANVAPVQPHAALAAIERAGTLAWPKYLRLVRSIAYEAELFDRCATILSHVALAGESSHDREEAGEILASLMTVQLSGTHASYGQRIAVIEGTFARPLAEKLGLRLLKAYLQTAHFGGHFGFEFGGRSRDYGSWPRTSEALTEWFRAGLTLAERLAQSDGPLAADVRGVIGDSFRGLWTFGRQDEQLAPLALRLLKKRYWPEGWLSCRQTLHFDRARLTEQSLQSLEALEVQLRPTNISERARSLIAGRGLDDIYDGESSSEETITQKIHRKSLEAIEVAEALGHNTAALEQIVPRLVRSGQRLHEFGRGLARRVSNPTELWLRLVSLLDITSSSHSASALVGLTSELFTRDRAAAERLLDLAVDNPRISLYFPTLQASVAIDDRGIARLLKSLRQQEIPARAYSSLAHGRASDSISSSDLRELLALIQTRDGGQDVALDILAMRIFSAHNEGERLDDGFANLCCDYLLAHDYAKSDDNGDYHLGEIAAYCMKGTEKSDDARSLVSILLSRVKRHLTYFGRHDQLLRVLFRLQPAAVLDVLIGADDADAWMLFDDFEDDHRRNPADEMSADALIAWCREDSGQRFVRAAGIVSIEGKKRDDGTRGWSEHAVALLTNAPDPKQVLSAFIPRFDPSGWSGSLVMILESRALLMDQLAFVDTTGFAGLIEETKGDLAKKISQQRQWENRLESERDETFE